MIETFLIISLTTGLVLLILGIVTAVYTDYKDYKRMSTRHIDHNGNQTGLVPGPLPPQTDEIPTSGTTIDKLKRWLVDQTERAKFAWTVIVGVALFFGYSLTLVPTGVVDVPPLPDPEPGLSVTAPYEPVEGDTTIVVKGEILSINGYRVRKIQD